MNMHRFCGALVLSIFLLAGPLKGQAGAVTIPGDFDDDGDVDLADFAEFQTCALGPAIDQPDAACTDAQFDADWDVDSNDFGEFQSCLSGPDNPADPNCACLWDQTSCDGTCTRTASDEANCGACGNACATGLVCQNEYGCQPCAGHYLACSGDCVDPWTHVGHCGGCGIICAGGQTCQGGSCQDQEPCWDCGGG